MNCLDESNPDTKPDVCGACGRPTDRLDLEDLCPDCSLDGEEDDDTFEWCDACAPEPCSCGGVG